MDFDKLKFNNKNMKKNLVYIIALTNVGLVSVF